MQLTLLVVLFAVASLGTPNLVDLYVDSWSFGQTGFEDSCNASVLEGKLFSDWQEVFESSSFGALGEGGGIIYSEINVNAPGNLVVGVAADDTQAFYGHIHTGASMSLGASVHGFVEDVTIDLTTKKRIAGSGSGGPPSSATLRRLNPVQIESTNVPMPSSLNPPTGNVYGDPSDTTGNCLAPPCPSISRWEVRVVVSNSSVGVWAWSEGYHQYYYVFEGVDLRFSALTLHVFNMNKGSESIPLLPKVSGLDMRVKQEMSFSRVASRIYTAPEIRENLGSSSLFSLPTSPRYALAPASTTGVCPALNFLATDAVSSGYTPLLVWSLADLGVQLNADRSYTVNFEAFITNLTSVNSTVFVSLYDGARAMGVVLQPPQDGIWAEVIAAPTGLNADASLNFPIGAPFLPGSSHTPPAPVLAAAEPYSSRRVSLTANLFLVTQVNTTERKQSNSIFGSDPEAPLAQQALNNRKRMMQQRSTNFPLTPSVGLSNSSNLDLFMTAASNLRAVVWVGNPDVSTQVLDVGITGAAIIIDEAEVGCDGLDSGGNFGPPPVFDICGVCGGNNQSCGCPNGTCCDYNGVSDDCWNWLLLQTAVADNLRYLTSLRKQLMEQCPLLDQGTEGAQSCCSASVWNETQQIQTRACDNNRWGPMCLLPFQQQVEVYSDALSAFVSLSK